MSAEIKAAKKAAAEWFSKPRTYRHLPDAVNALAEILASHHRAADTPLNGATPEMDQLRETITRLNRRCQVAERALPDWHRVAQLKFVQGSFGRALLAFAISEANKENEKLRAWIEKAHHHDKCRWRLGSINGFPPRCSCGRNELLLREEERQTSNGPINVHHYDPSNPQPSTFSA